MGTSDKARSGGLSAVAGVRYEDVDPLVLRRGDRVAVSFGVLTVRGVEAEGPSVRMLWEEDQPSVAVHRCNLVSRLVVAVQAQGPTVPTAEYGSDGRWSDLRRASLADTRRRYEVACWEAVHGDLGGADSAEWAAHVAWCFVAGWRPLVCVGYWSRGGKRGSAV